MSSRGDAGVVVVAGGDPPDPSARAYVPRCAWVIAADSGVDHALALGLPVDHAVGDFDSVSPKGLQALAAAGTPIERHPAAKDATDVELALEIAALHRPLRLLLIGEAGGRLDHTLGILTLLAAPAYAGIEVTARLGTALVTVVRDRRSIHGSPGDLVSLIPVLGPGGGVTTAGLRWPLTDAVLEAGSSRGISNEFVGGTAYVRVVTGVLLAIQPEAPREPPPAYS